MKLETKIIDIVEKENGKPIPSGIIVRKLTTKEPALKPKDIFKEIDNLVERRKLRITDSRKVLIGYVEAPIKPDSLSEGVISINSKGDGYIRSLDPENTQE